MASSVSRVIARQCEANPSRHGSVKVKVETMAPLFIFRPTRKYRQACVCLLSPLRSTATGPLTLAGWISRACMLESGLFPLCGHHWIAD